jgi:hypothetical protein
MGFGFIACQHSVPSLQRILDYTDQSIEELEMALSLDAQATNAFAAQRAVKKPANKKSPA